MMSDKGFLDRDTEEKIKMIEKAVKEKDTSVIQPLILHLRYPILQLRLAAIHALGELKAQEAIGKIVQYGLMDTNETVRKTSIESLVKIGGKDINTLFYKIIDEVIKIHKEGYFIGDANIKHFFFIDKKIEGLIDFESIRKVKIFKIKRFCRDLGYLLRPELKIEDEKIQDIVIYYSKKMNLPYSKILFNTERYRFRRWGYKILK
ncbi:MAG: HEAT repeat domain-containing protein [Thermoplasmata archaeon]